MPSLPQLLLLVLVELVYGPLQNLLALIVVVAAWGALDDQEVLEDDRLLPTGAIRVVVLVTPDVWRLVIRVGYV